MSDGVRKPFIIAHRGASALAPENTLAAFQKAIEDGAEGIEFDVQLSKDGIPVVFHDFRLDRIARKKGCVSDFKSEELQSFDAGSWFNLKFPNKAKKLFSAETIPTLNQLLKHLKDYKGLIYIELKCRQSETDALVKAVCEVIGKSKLFPFFIVKSFNLEAVFQIKQKLPELQTAALFEPKIKTILQNKRILLEKAEKYSANEVSIHCSMVTENFVQKANERGLLVTIWTANNPIWIKRGIDLGINSVITNNPAKMLAKKKEIFNGK